VAACALALAVLSSAASAAGEPPAAHPAVPGHAPGATGIGAAVRAYLGVSPSTRLVIAAPVIHGSHASVSVERYAGPLAGEGETLRLDRVSGKWQVVPSAHRPDWVNWAGVRPRRGA
jgi:hypothetical protein